MEFWAIAFVGTNLSKLKGAFPSHHHLFSVAGVSPIEPMYREQLVSSQARLMDAK